mmetsp:Transcript_47656/g.126368  ORF Transcript_47656/g.126368 Transcript_47656/m.126368 type:complete len:178 (+) Transcript_47656:35-568(+)
MRAAALCPVQAVSDTERWQSQVLAVARSKMSAAPAALPLSLALQTQSLSTLQAPLPSLMLLLTPRSKFSTTSPRVSPSVSSLYQSKADSTAHWARWGERFTTTVEDCQCWTEAGSHRFSEPWRNRGHMAPSTRVPCSLCPHLSYVSFGLTLAVPPHRYPLYLLSPPVSGFCLMQYCL